MIKYSNNLKNITTENLEVFFDGWPNPPSAAKHLELLKNSDYIWLAVDDNTGNVIGFITAISDKVLSAYMPLLEVLPEYKNKGIGSELVKRMLETLKDYYMIDLLCDENLVDFYKRFKMFKSQAMIIRNHQNQNGKGQGL